MQVKSEGKSGRKTKTKKTPKQDINTRHVNIVNYKNKYLKKEDIHPAALETPMTTSFKVPSPESFIPHIFIEPN